MEIGRRPLKWYIWQDPRPWRDRYGELTYTHRQQLLLDAVTRHHFWDDGIRQFQGALRQYNDRDDLPGEYPVPDFSYIREVLLKCHYEDFEGKAALKPYEYSDYIMRSAPVLTRTYRYVVWDGEDSSQFEVFTDRGAAEAHTDENPFYEVGIFHVEDLAETFGEEPEDPLPVPHCDHHNRAWEDDSWEAFQTRVNEGGPERLADLALYQYDDGEEFEAHCGHCDTQRLGRVRRDPPVVSWACLDCGWDADLRSGENDKWYPPDVLEA